MVQQEQEWAADLQRERRHKRSVQLTVTKKKTKPEEKQTQPRPHTQTGIDDTTRKPSAPQEQTSNSSEETFVPYPEDSVQDATPNRNDQNQANNRRGNLSQESTDTPALTQEEELRRARTAYRTQTDPTASLRQQQEYISLLKKQALYDETTRNVLRDASHLANAEIFGAYLSQKIKDGAFRYFLLALFFAILDDIMDVVLAFTTAGTFEFTLKWVVSPFVSVVIFAIIFSSGPIVRRLIIKRLGLYLALAVVELIPFLGAIVPASTCSIIVFKVLADRERRKYERAKVQLNDFERSRRNSIRQTTQQ